MELIRADRQLKSKGVSLTESRTMSGFLAFYRYSNGGANPAI
jgi:hypothetical protein